MTTNDPSRSDAPKLGSVAVVIPTYNDRDRLARAVQSVLGQTLLPATIVISDDGSTDGTDLVVARLAKDAPIEIIYAWGENTGGIEARNRGVKLTNTDWVASCDSDDLWLPTKLERQVQVIESWAGRRPLVALATDGYNVNDREQIISLASMGPKNERECDEIRASGGLFYCLHSSLVVRRSTFDLVSGYSSEYGAAHDADLLCRLADHGAIVVVPEPLTLYRKRASSMQLAAFWTGPLGIARLAENRRRERDGKPTLDVEAFIAHMRSQSLPRRLHERRRVAGLYFYRRGAVRLVNRERLRGLADLAVAGALAPERLRSGIRGVARRLVKR